MQFLTTHLLLIIIFLILILLLWQYYKGARIRKLINKIPGPPTWPIIGNALTFYVDPAEMMHVLKPYVQAYPKFVRYWIGNEAFVALYHSDSIKEILSSSDHIDKAFMYSFLEPWLGTGLLTSGGSKWHSRRKLLTPSFHFRILEDFVSVFNEQSETLVKILSKEAEKPVIDIAPLLTLCTLDIVCDSIMGQHVNAQNNRDSPYVKATQRIKEIFYNRYMRLHLWPDWIFNRTPLGKEQKKCLEVLHSFTDKVIQKKKEEFKLREKCVDKKDSFFGKQSRLAFLDLLIEASDDGKVLSDADIREEVDTFTFEGHDTIASTLGWILYFLGSYPPIQERVHNEIIQVLGRNTSRHVTSEDTKEMKFLECVIKETLRLVPVVHSFARYLRNDAVIDGYIVPAGTTAMIMPVYLHRDPDIFPNPEAFDPDRFLKENSHGRHPYAYIPFSAGPRNCIGQKFAMMELKIVLSYVLQAFVVKSLDSLSDLQITGEMIIRSKSGIKVNLKPRYSCS